jgi:hypothetical protein
MATNDERKHYLIVCDVGRWTAMLNREEVEQIYHKYQGFVKVTEISPPLPDTPLEKVEFDPPVEIPECFTHLVLPELGDPIPEGFTLDYEAIARELGE